MKELQKVIEYFGEHNQIHNKTPEELKELIIAIESGEPEKIFEEYCDVIVMLNQVKEIYNWDNEDIRRQCRKKVFRTLARIRNGYYEGEEDA